jgi:hypothetical protein
MRQILLIVIAICSAVVPTWAVDIPIANAGFEQVILPCAPGPTCAVIDVFGWTATGQIATFKPSTGPGGVFPGGIPEGLNTGGVGNQFGIGILEQTLGAALQPNTTYTLVYSVGSRIDGLFSGYSIELLAGSATVAKDSSLSPASGTFVTGRIVYSSSANPALLGQRLGIRLTSAGRGGAHFDKISLDATPTMISSSASQFASGGGWKTTLTLVNLSPTQNSVRLGFRGADGRPLTLPVVITQQGASQPAVSVDRTIEPGATLVVESEAPASVATLVGWAEVTSSGPLAGFAIFRQRGPDGRDSEGTAPVESSRASSLVLPFDNTGGFSTGVALVNVTTDAVVIKSTRRYAMKTALSSVCRRLRCPRWDILHSPSLSDFP